MNVAQAAILPLLVWYLASIKIPQNVGIDEGNTAAG